MLCLQLYFAIKKTETKSLHKTQGKIQICLSIKLTPIQPFLALLVFVVRPL